MLLGVGLRREHFDEVLAQKPAIGWFELLSENYMHQGSPNLNKVIKIREAYPMSLHGVGLSLGSRNGVSTEHLKQVQSLIKQIDPFIISEHLAWSRINDWYVPDLLPVPYHADSLAIFCENINKVQDFLQREILIENPSSYLEYKASEQSEVEFLVSLCQTTGAKILLDINNIYVSCNNHAWDPINYLQNIPVNLVKQFHIAGHSTKRISSGKILCIDTHDNYVCDEVWDLYHVAVERFGDVPTLLEWDEQIPPLDVLISEVNKANAHVMA